MAIRIETQLDHSSESMRYIARAVLDGRCIYEVGEYGGPPDSIDEIRTRLCRNVADFVTTEHAEAIDHYWVERYEANKQVWDRRTLSD